MDYLNKPDQKPPHATYLTAEPHITATLLGAVSFTLNQIDHSASYPQRSDLLGLRDELEECSLLELAPELSDNHLHILMVALQLVMGYLLSGQTLQGPPDLLAELTTDKVNAAMTAVLASQATSLDNLQIRRPLNA